MLLIVSQIIGLLAVGLYLISFQLKNVGRSCGQPAFPTLYMFCNTYCSVPFASRSLFITEAVI